PLHLRHLRVGMWEDTGSLRRLIVSDVRPSRYDLEKTPEHREGITPLPTGEGKGVRSTCPQALCRQSPACLRRQVSGWLGGACWPARCNKHFVLCIADRLIFKGVSSSITNTRR